MATRVGISGWRYEPWRGVFYPSDLTQTKELYYASRQVSSIEINGSFYSLQTPKSYKNWFQQTPDDFVFSAKAPQYVTHIRRLHDVEKPIANFFASGILHLQQKLGPILWQFPPSFLFKDELLEPFFKMLPRTFAEAVTLTGSADRVEPDYPASARKSSQPIRHAIEIRHHSFENPDFIEMLHQYKVALVFADTANRWPYMEDITSDFLYLRLHGDEEIYRSGYDDATLNWWADRIRLWQKGEMPSDTLRMVEKNIPRQARDIFVYFDNDVKVRAPFDAIQLNKKIS